MWLITETGFVSFVRDRKDTSKVWARARIREDIANMFPDHDDDIITKIGADYIYRLLVDKEEAATAVAAQIFALDYTSHAKEEMNRRSHPNKERMGAYYSIWTALSRLQPVRPYAHRGLVPETTSKTLPALPAPKPYTPGKVATYTGQYGSADGWLGEEYPTFKAPTGKGYPWARGNKSQPPLPLADDIVMDDMHDVPDEVFGLDDDEFDAFMRQRDAQIQGTGTAHRGRRGGASRRRGKGRRRRA